MKPIFALLPLALGIGAAGVAMTIQMNRYAFTSARPEPAPWVEAVRVVPPRRPASIQVAARESAVVSIDEVTIMGYARRAPVRPAMRPAEPVEPAPVVVPAPCNDGEYRKLDEKRGVKLLCPGGSL
jgi:hypothetical protein